MQQRRYRYLVIAAVALCANCSWATVPDAAIGVVLEPVELNTIVGTANPIAVYLVRADGDSARAFDALIRPISAAASGRSRRA